MEDTIRRGISASIEAKQRLLAGCVPAIRQAAEEVAGALRTWHRVWLVGNGGSAADAQHIACEMVGRFRRERRALPVQALTVDPSIMTAVANDYGYEHVFARQVEAHASAGDVLIAISTSGESANVIRACEVAARIGARTIGLLGRGGGRLAGLVDVPVVVPSDDTQRVQECHTMIGHLICEVVEADLCR